MFTPLSHLNSGRFGEMEFHRRSHYDQYASTHMLSARHVDHPHMLSARHVDHPHMLSARHVRPPTHAVCTQSRPPTHAVCKVPTHPHQFNYRTELQAINAAIQHLVQRGGRGKSIAVLADSLSAIQSLESGPIDQATREMYGRLQSLSKHNKCSGYRHKWG